MRNLIGWLNLRPCLPGFKEPKNADAWQYFFNTHRDLASGFDIILAELRIDSLFL